MLLLLLFPLLHVTIASDAPECCPVCKSVVESEFQPEQARCFENNTICKSGDCILQLLDLTFCIHESNQNRLNYSKSIAYNVTLNSISAEKNIPFSSACRKCFAERGNCSINFVTPATLWTKPLDIFFAALSCTFDVYGIWHIFSYRIHATAYFGSIFWLLVLCPFTSIAIALFKLFPEKYRCDTFTCRVLVHNAILSLAVFLFEVLEIYFEYIIENYKARKHMEDNVVSVSPILEASLVISRNSFPDENDEHSDAGEFSGDQNERAIPVNFDEHHSADQDFISENERTSLPPKNSQSVASKADQYTSDDLLYLEIRKAESANPPSTCIRMLEKFRKLNKVCGLLSSTLWLLKDFSDFSSMSPGPGTLAIGMVAIAASLLLLLGQFWAERHVFSCLCNLSGLKPPPRPPSVSTSAVKEVRGHAGQFLDCVEFVLVSGETSLYGHMGGSAVEPSLVLEPAEHIQTVRWKPGGHYAGCGIEFKTSSGREYLCHGSAFAADRTQRVLEWSAPPGEEVVGLRVEAGRNSWQEITLVKGIHTSPLT
jgi:hypothetical protein